LKDPGPSDGLLNRNEERPDPPWGALGSRREPVKGALERPHHVLTALVGGGFRSEGERVPVGKSEQWPRGQAVATQHLSVA
jgi:hypothetical protein